MRYLFLICTLVSICSAIQAQTVTNQFYSVKAGNGNGIKFWGNIDHYKIHMGNTALNHYGPVSSYSIKMNMNNDTKRGWVWGTTTKTIAGLNTQGNFQLKGWLKVESKEIRLGNDHQIKGGGNASIMVVKNNHSTVSQLIMLDKEGKAYGRLYGNNNGKHFGLLDGDGNWSYLAVKDNYSSFLINNSEKIRIQSNGNVGIGTSTPSNKLHVNGAARITGRTFMGNITDEGNMNYKLFVEKGILAEKVRVAVKHTTDWADYVFEPTYDLMPLEEVSSFITKNKHLPGVPSAEEVVENGIDMAKMDAVLLKKLEEAYLHILDLKAEINEIKSELQNHKK